VVASAWSRYVCKYALKCEVSGSLELDEAALTKLGLHNTSLLQGKLASAAFTSKPMGPGELALIATGEPLVVKSFTVKYVDCRPPEQRTLTFLHGSGVFINEVTRYGGRPRTPDLSGLTFPEYFAQYEVRSPKEGKPSDALRNHAPMVDQFGSNVWRLTERRMVRLTDHHPAHQAQAFFHRLLLERVPLQESEEEILPSDGSYFNECVRQGILAKAKDLHDVLEAYATFHMYDMHVVSNLREQLQATTDITLLAHSIGDVDLANLTAEEAEAHTEFMESLFADDSWDGDGEPLCNTLDMEEGHEGSIPIEAMEGMMGEVVQELGATSEGGPHPVQDTSHSSGNNQDYGPTPLPLSAMTAEEIALLKNVMTLGNDQMGAMRGIIEEINAAATATQDYQDPVVLFMSGGPGTGKTHALKHLLPFLKALGHRVLITATKQQQPRTSRHQKQTPWMQRLASHHGGYSPRFTQMAQLLTGF
jgi:hypothetical protein